MTDSRGAKGQTRATESASDDIAREDAVERALGRGIAVGLPVVSVLGAVTLGVVASAGSGMLVLAGGALLGAIGLLWASVRTLSGDAPLAAGFDTMAEASKVDLLLEEKRRLLRGLKDLENEHELGKIEGADYQILLARYREEAKAIMRELDGRVAPYREDAERLARDYLQKRGLATASAYESAPTGGVPSVFRIACAQCGISNDGDAAFCKKCGKSLKREERGAKA